MSIINFRSPPKPMTTELVMPCNNLCRPLLLLPSIFPSIRVFSNKLALRIKWTKYWSFSLNISSSNEHPGLISFRMDRLDFLAVQGTLKSLLQNHSPKASIFRRSAHHPYYCFWHSTVCLYRRRRRHPTPVLLPGESHKQGSLAGYSTWGCKSRT